MDIGSRVRTARKAKGLTQEELARRAGVNLSVVGLLERGATLDPHVSNLRSIAHALDMQTGALLGEPVPLGETPVEERVNRADFGQLIEIKDDNPEEIDILLAQIPLPQRVQELIGQSPEALTPGDRRNLRRVVEAAEEYRLAVKRLEAERGRERQGSVHERDKDLNA